MAIAIKVHTDESDGALAARTTSLKNDAKIAFILFTGIVKDKVGYAVRELTKNAWEVSPPDKPFVVDLPTRWNPRLRIRDYGPGLSHHFMMYRYAALGDSTKDANGIGGVSGWGLGSKSPLAYLMEDDLSGSFSVISYREGIASHYIISLDSGGMPQVKHFMDVPTEEPDGLEVSFAVREDDYDAFADAAERILWSFDPRPIITPDPEFAEAVVTAKGGNWTMFARHSVPFKGPQVRVGPVMYPIDMGEIEGSVGFLQPSDDIIFDLPPDQVSPTASREQLQYTSSTKRALSAMVQEYERSYLDGVQQKVDAADCYFGGCEAFYDETRALGIDRARRMRDRIQWGGQPIRTGIDGTVMRLRKQWSTFDRFRRETIDPREVAKSKVVIEHNPYMSLDRFLALDLVGEDILWARVKKADLPDFLSMCALKESDVTILDQAPLERRPVGNQHGATRNNQIRRRRMITIKQSAYAGYEDVSMTEDTATVDLAEGGLYVRKTFGWSNRRKDHYFVGGGYPNLNESYIRSLLGRMVRLNIIDKPIQVLVDTGSDDLDTDLWSPIGDYCEMRLNDLYDPTGLTPISTQKKAGDMSHELRTLCGRDYPDAPADLKKLRRDFVKLDRELRQVEPNTETLSDQVFDALKILKPTMTRPTVKPGVDPVDKINADYAALNKKYPLLAGIRSSYIIDKEPLLANYFTLLSNQKD